MDKETVNRTGVRESADREAVDRDAMVEVAKTWYAKKYPMCTPPVVQTDAEDAVDFAIAHQAAEERILDEGLRSYQENVWKWCKATFDGIVAWDIDRERAYRFFEEAGELFQAMNMTREDAYKVVDYVFNRSSGDRSQEIGGVMITLLALASQQGLDVQESMQTEYERIMRPEIQEKIRAKQLAKKQALV